jgi:hypothetical protein
VIAKPKPRWWRRIQWIDVVMVVVAVVVLLFLTAELWMPHLGPE